MPVSVLFLNDHPALHLRAFILKVSHAPISFECLFSMTLRCGIAVDAGSGKTKKTLKVPYRSAMMKYHPDRTRSASVEQQALAAEVTKWITHAWQTIRD
jgi:hypothetical protein